MLERSAWDWGLALSARWVDVMHPWGRSRLLPPWDKDALKVPREFPGPIPSMDGHCETDVGVTARGRDGEAVRGGILGQRTDTPFCSHTKRMAAIGGAERWPQRVLPALLTAGLPAGQEMGPASLSLARVTPDTWLLGGGRAGAMVGTHSSSEESA